MNSLKSLTLHGSERGRRYFPAWPPTPLFCIGTASRGFRWLANFPGSSRREVVRPHVLLNGFAPDLSIPHSRLNGLDETALANKGYVTLVRSDKAGVDLFVKDQASLLVFLQGHPEYDADSLAREFRRDLLRYLAGERQAPPDPPARYFSADALAEVEAFIERARNERQPELAGCFPPAALNKAGNALWHRDSQRLYRNWVAIIAERKAALQPSLAVAR